MSESFSKAWRGLFLIGLVSGALLAQAPAPYGNTPSGSHIVKIQNGHIDAVTGALDLSIPLGPKLPGRIPLGFTWAFSTADYSTAQGGVFEPIIWPNFDPNSTDSLVTMRVFGSTWTFLRQAPGATLPTSEDVTRWATDLGVLDQGEPGVTVEAIYPSSDGTKFYVRFSRNLHGSCTAVLMGDSAVSYSSSDWVTTRATFSNRWGDQVKVKVTGFQYPDYLAASYVIQNERVPSQSITMATTYQAKVNGAYTSLTLQVTNTLGFPSATASGECVVTGDPLLLRLSSVTWGSRTITFSTPWGTIQPPHYRPDWISHSSGLKETFTYGLPGLLSGGGCFSPSGAWVGFNLENGPWQGMAYGVTEVKTEGVGSGQKTMIVREMPFELVDYTSGGGVSKKWAFKSGKPIHRTSVLTYPTANPDASSVYRGMRLTHPSGLSWVTYNDAQAFLFATSVILSAESIHGTGLGSIDPPGGFIVDQQVLYDGWDLHSWCNPDGSLAAAVPVSAVALRSRTWAPKLPLRTQIAGNPNLSGARDLYGPTLTREYTEGTASQLSIDSTQPSMWSSGLTDPNDKPVRRTGQITREWSKAKGVLNTLTEHKWLDGTQVPRVSLGEATPSALQPISSSDFGTTTIHYDPVTGLPDAITGKRGDFTSTESRTYGVAGSNQVILPLVTKSIKTLTGPKGNIPANPDNLGVQVGTEYQYDGTAFHWLSAQRDLSDGRWTTFLRDALGRETSRTDGLGITTTTTYDEWGRVETVTRLAMGNVGALTTTHSYDVNGLWKEVKVVGEGRTLITHTTLDAFGRPTSEYTSNGPTLLTVKTMGYDGFGQKVAESPTLVSLQAESGLYRWTYSDKGQVTATFDLKGNRISSAYAPATPSEVWEPQLGTVKGVFGIITKTWDARGYLRQEVRDLLGQKIAVIDQKDQLSQYAYDGDGHLIWTNQDGQIRWYLYNDMGWLIKRYEPEEGVTQFDSHTMLGVPRTTTQVRGSKSWATSTTFNEWLLPSTITASGPEGTVSRSLQYYPNHLVSSLSETQLYGALTETYGYDDAFRLNRKSVSDGIRSFNISRTLDAFGLETSLTTPEGGGRPSQSVVSDLFDAFGRPKRVKLNGVQRGLMDYDQLSGSAISTVLTFGNGSSTKTTLDKGELTKVEHAVVNAQGHLTNNLDSTAFTWLPGGLMSTRGSDVFQYDQLSRLTQAVVTGVQGESATQDFTYDRWGNRLTSSYTFNAGSNNITKPEELVAWTAVVNAYAPANQLPSSLTIPGGTVNTFRQYDEVGRITQVNAIPGVDSSRITFGYDPLGRVVQEAVQNGTRSFLLDGEGLRFKRRAVDGSIEYTVYGFHREPLSYFFYKPAAEAKQAKAAVGMKAAQSKKVALALRPPPEEGPCGAYILAPQSGKIVQVGQGVSFEGATDSGNVFLWTFGDGAEATGKYVSHVYASAGTYNVRFTAMDRYMASPQSTTTISITVLPLAPTITLDTTAGTIPAGVTATLTWSAPGATTCTLNGLAVAATGSLPVTPTQTTNYTLTAGNSGGSTSRTVTVTVVPKPVIPSFTASPTGIYQGDGSTLYWTVSGATSLSLDNGIGIVTGRSSIPISPSGSTTYTLTATNTLNGVNAISQAQVFVTVNPRPTVPSITSFYSDAANVPAGGRTILRWSVSNAVGALQVTLNGAAVAASGTQEVSPSTTSTYTLVATNTQDTSKTVSQSVQVGVVAKPVIHFSASPTSVYAGGSSTLNWSVDNLPDTVSIDQGLGSRSAVGSVTVSPAGTTTYTVTAENLAGRSTASVTVGVTPSAVVGSFTASQTQVTQGASATLNWSTQGATGVTLNGAPVNATASGYVVAPSTTTTYTLIATNPAGSDSRSLSITVIVPEAFTWTKTLIYGFGQLLSEERPNGTFYIQSDRLGSPSLITDGSGRLVGRSKQLPFGERFGGWGEQSTRRYTNHEDQPGSAIYMQARMYLPAYGKFAQVDPAYDQMKDDPETWNLYNYVTNNPVTHTDPDGRMQFCLDGLIIRDNNEFMDTWGYGTRISNGWGAPVTFVGLPGGGSTRVDGTQGIAPSAETNSEPGNGQRVAKGPTTIAPGQDLSAERKAYPTEEKAAAAAILEINTKYGDQTSTREFGTLIYKDNGGYHYTPIVMGPTPAPGERAAVDLRVLIKENLVPQQSLITANLHTHPINKWSGRPSGEDVIIIRTSKYYNNYIDMGRQVSPQLNGYLWTNSFGSNLLSYTGTPSPDFTDGSVSKYGWIRF